MFGQLRHVSALLLGSALLLFAGGIHGLILPVRGSAEGFSATSLGLLGTGWAIGYVLGCIFVPRLVGLVGHTRVRRHVCVCSGRNSVSIPDRCLMGMDTGPGCIGLLFRRCGNDRGILAQ